MSWYKREIAKELKLDIEDILVSRLAFIIDRAVADKGTSGKDAAFNEGRDAAAKRLEFIMIFDHPDENDQIVEFIKRKDAIAIAEGVKRK